MTRVAGIDCGTNSIRLLVADLADDGLRDVHREMRVVRLGQGVDRTGRLAPEAIARTRTALADYARIVADLRTERVRMVATSATRDAANRADFAAMVRAVIGLDAEIITGAEEAELSFAGAASVLPDARGPVLVADIGGGSTELVRGDFGSGRPPESVSMDVGCVRMTERHLHGDPPTPPQVEAAVADVRAAISRARTRVPLDPQSALIGVAGTVTTIAAIALGLDRYDAAAIHGSRIRAGQVAKVTDDLLTMTHAERAAVPVMHPGRVDVIGGGALVLRTLVEEAGVGEVIASEHDILDGLALSLRERGATRR